MEFRPIFLNTINNDMRPPKFQRNPKACAGCKESQQWCQGPIAQLGNKCLKCHEKNIDCVKRKIYVSYSYSPDQTQQSIGPQTVKRIFQENTLGHVNKQTALYQQTSPSVIPSNILCFTRNESQELLRRKLNETLVMVNKF